MEFKIRKQLNAFAANEARAMVLLVLRSDDETELYSLLVSIYMIEKTTELRNKWTQPIDDSRFILKLHRKMPTNVEMAQVDCFMRLFAQSDETTKFFLSQSIAIV